MSAATLAEQIAIPAVLMRGGTSKGLVFKRADLPDRAAWDPLFLAAMGSPDPYGRQLDGIGGGVSSLSKVCVVGPPSRPDADVDYTFAQVSVAKPVVDYTGNCGNMSSAIGPFAVAERLVPAPADGVAEVRIHNTNTGRIIVSRFPVAGGQPVEVGDTVIPGVAGSGAPIELAFVEPGGAVTGRLLPTGRARDDLDIEGVGRVTVSLVDAANPVVFLLAETVGLSGTELPTELERQPATLATLEAIRRAGSVAMGIAADLEAAGQKVAIPQVCLVSGPKAAATLAGTRLAPGDLDLTVRMISTQQPHRATPMTGALCTAAAAAVPGSLVHAVTGGRAAAGGLLRLGHPSGITEVRARVEPGADGLPVVREASVRRTARRLMKGDVVVPKAWLSGVSAGR